MSFPKLSLPKMSTTNMAILLAVVVFIGLAVFAGMKYMKREGNENPITQINPLESPCPSGQRRVEGKCV